MTGFESKLKHYNQNDHLLFKASCTYTLCFASIWISLFEQTNFNFFPFHFISTDYCCLKSLLTTYDDIVLIVPMYRKLPLKLVFLLVSLSPLHVAIDQQRLSRLSHFPCESQQQSQSRLITVTTQPPSNVGLHQYNCAVSPNLLFDSRCYRWSSLSQKLGGYLFQEPLPLLHRFRRYTGSILNGAVELQSTRDKGARMFLENSETLGTTLFWDVYARYFPL